MLGLRTFNVRLLRDSFHLKADSPRPRAPAILCRPTNHPMPRQNRVTPFGELIATSARGSLMGNRGCLHDASGRIVRRTRLNAWIYCLLEFKGRRRAVMSPGRYTELFFLDVASALAAGHRPCAVCQRGRYKEFMRCWGEGNRELWEGEKLRAPVVDAVLQRERMGKGGKKVKWRAKVGELPVGVMVEVGVGKAGVVVEGGVREWGVGGYGRSSKQSDAFAVEVLTPQSTVTTIEAGFVVPVN